jgi:hypothetical protein
MGKATQRRIGLVLKRKRYVINKIEKEEDPSVFSRIGTNFPVVCSMPHA